MQPRWYEIAEELGSYDMENTSYGFDPCYQMVKQEREYYGYAPGYYVEAEPACRRIEELERRCLQRTGEPAGGPSGIVGRAYHKQVVEDLRLENARMECLLRQCEIFLAIHANPENTLLRDIRETWEEKE